jgi:sulfatase modifying factor 1
MRIAWPLIGLCAGVACASCGPDAADPRPQWVARVDSDVPVPQFGDQLLIEVVGNPTDVPCAGCRRLFALETHAAWPSFGIAAEGFSSPPYVRARLFRHDYVGPDGLPSSPALIDLLARLPPASGVTPVTLSLRISCFGIPADTANGTTCNPANGAVVRDLRLERAGNASPMPLAEWSPQRPCAAAVPSDMACVEGGAFLLGASSAFVLSPVISTTPERLVVLSPFALDRDELTVGAVRQLAGTHVLANPPTRRSPANDLDAMCTYLGPDDAAGDALPINCISRAGAEEVCALLGKRLPTEAEWEYAAGNRSEESPYPWGGEPDDICVRAIVGRGRYLTEMTSALTEATFCRTRAATALPSGPVAGGEARDVTSLGVRNLGGNVDEWVADSAAAYSDPCWAGAFPLVDPRCDGPSSGRHSVRGGSWASLGLLARATARNALGAPDPYTGARCARDAR